jgi:hypothetical protein
MRRRSLRLLDRSASLWRFGSLAARHGGNLFASLTNVEHCMMPTAVETSDRCVISAQHALHVQEGMLRLGDRRHLQTQV